MAAYFRESKCGAQSITLASDRRAASEAPAALEAQAELWPRGTPKKTEYQRNNKCATKNSTINANLKTKNKKKWLSFLLFFYGWLSRQQGREVKTQLTMTKTDVTYIPAAGC